MPTKSPSAAPPPPVVITVHGIRDNALWQQEIRDTLSHCGFKVIPTNYGRFDLFRFLFPLKYFRRKATAKVLIQINIAFHQYPDSNVSVIAHSFGTYIVGNIIKENFNIKFDKIIFCGSILPYDFPFQDYLGRFTPDILNEVGTKDIWPAFAESVTFGYGSAGTFGFNRGLVFDRWHNGARHGYFLERRFCKKFWIPFLRDGTIVADSPDPDPPGLLVRLVQILKIKYLLTLVALSVAALWYFQVCVSCVLPEGQACLGMPGETAWIDGGLYDRDTKEFKSEASFTIAGSPLASREVKRGDWVKPIRRIKTIILDYDTQGTKRAFESPGRSDGPVAHTCRELTDQDRVYVAYIDISGPSDDHMWLRVRENRGR